MTWAVLLKLLLEMLGPILRKLLEDLLSRAADRAAADFVASASPGVVVRELFAAARRETWPWQVGRRRLLAAVERVAVARANDLLAAATANASAPRLTRAEEAEIAAAL